jgi:DNA-binding response OmpR family regulator
MDEQTQNSQEAHILVVDDEGAIRYSVSKTLQRVGYRVSVAASGDEALAMAKAQDFDVVLSDIRMPSLSGVDLLASIKEHYAEAVVILMTGFSSMNIAVECLRYGAFDYLIKPVSNQDIRQSVARGVERARIIKHRRFLLNQIFENVKQLTQYEQESRPRPTEQRPANGFNARAQTSSTMTIGPLTIFPGRYQIHVNEQELELTPTEFDLLVYLAANGSRVVPCFELVREVRNYIVEESEAREVIRPHISNLRRKLLSAGQDPDLIMNVRGVGYRLADPNSPMPSYELNGSHGL